ncbi:MAG TPA: hypothetical protein VJ827_09340 [Rubrobacter sp.]|nr:hypothetical protein [Rubrobacter sp.]
MRGIRPLRPVAFTVLAALALVRFYPGIITLAQGWGHALQQLADDLPFVGANVAGFGTQVGLFTYLRGMHAQAAVGGAAAGHKVRRLGASLHQQDERAVR